MPDITLASLGTIGGLAIAVALLTTVLKPVIFGDASDLQDRFAPLLAIITGVVLALLAMVALPDALPVTRITWATAILNGIIGGALAVGGFTVLRDATR